jgi:hypothetical protein
MAVRATTLTVTKTSGVDAMLYDVPNVRVFRMSAELGISVGSVHSILHKDWIMHNVSQHLMAEMLTSEHSEPRISCKDKLHGP